MAKDIKSAHFEGKREVAVPKGAKILSKDIRITVKEIENGFLLCKSYDIRYEKEGNTDYLYVSKEWYSKENPMTINIDEKALADNF